MKWITWTGLLGLILLLSGCQYPDTSLTATLPSSVSYTRLIKSLGELNAESETLINTNNRDGRFFYAKDKRLRIYVSQQSNATTYLNISREYDHELSKEEARQELAIVKGFYESLRKMNPHMPSVNEVKINQNFKEIQ